ncbi:ATP-binding protein [Bradyrhizobium sp. CCBAU 11434]|uniref:ATP-binding protein n=1 Tax=Bradyrhizobium sp. CCBAU 11434 TaxID=1630885 RepID=UPI002305A082|nr:winged helix-turn-helix domain-containing protein [Bradyrhizobium sp. CCBAU 11434]
MQDSENKEAPGQQAIYECGDTQIDLDRRELRVGRVPVAIGSRAFDILEVLVQSAGELVTKNELMDKVWPGAAIGENTLQVHVSVLRKALGPASREVLKTVSGRGYRLVGDWILCPPKGTLPESRTDDRGREPRWRNPPSQLTQPLGREQSIRDLVTELPRQRLVTVVGAGGIGKTTVALAVAERIQATYEHRVCYVDLAPVEDGRHVPSALGSALGLSMMSDMPIQGIVRLLRDQQALIILDNCEHQIEAAALLVEAILSGAPGVTIFATSREPIGARGETTRQLGPIDLPPDGSSLSASQALGFSAIALFVQRARAGFDQFDFTDFQAPIVVGICRRLDGIPLAIELAAAQVRFLGVQGLDIRLRDRFALMMRGRQRTALPRHQTLQATLDWSFVTLTEKEQRLLLRMAAFRTPVPLDWIAMLADDFTELELAEVLGSLVTKSLVASDVGGPVAYYRLLELTRSYGLTKLSDSGELDGLSRRHAVVIYNIIAGIDRQDIPDKSRPSDVPVGLVDEVRSALDWAFASTGAALLAVELAAAAASLWIRQGLLAECRNWLESAVSLVGSSVEEDRFRDMRMYAALGSVIIQTAGPNDRMYQVLKHAADLADELGDDEYRLRSMWGLWIRHYLTGDYRGALLIAEHFTDLPETIPDRLIGERLLGMTLHVLGEQTKAREHLEHFLSRYRAPPGRLHLVRYGFEQRVVALIYQAHILWLQGFQEQACRLVKQAVADVTADGHAPTISNVLIHGACAIALQSRDYQAAKEFTRMLSQLASSQESQALAAWAECYDGALELRQQSSTTAIARLRSGLALLDRQTFQTRYVTFLGELALGELAAGNHASALQAISEAIGHADRAGERWYLAELLRIRGEIALGRRDYPAAEQCLLQAIDLAKQQSVPSWELRAATSLARLFKKQARIPQARNILDPIYRWFTEGFSNLDLVDAQNLLAAIG